MSDNDPEGDPARVFARALFAKDASEGEELAPPDPATANHVPGEGNNPTGEAHDMREFTRNLFYSHND